MFLNVTGIVTVFYTPVVGSPQIGLCPLYYISYNHHIDKLDNSDLFLNLTFDSKFIEGPLFTEHMVVVSEATNMGHSVITQSYGKRSDIKTL